MLRSACLPLLCLLLTACAAPQGMVKVKAGSFGMGTDRVDDKMEALHYGLPEPFYVDEQPFHQVTLPTYYIDRTEVTNAQYQKFLALHPEIDPPDDWSRRHYPDGMGEYPVVYVSWYNAGHYCKWRGAELPTEAEWEKAARGPESFIYPWGNRFDPQNANLSSGPFDRGRAHKADSMPQGAGPYGALHMVGNVWEWVADNYAPYPGNTEDVTAFGEEPPFKVMRGLSFEAVGHFPANQYARVVAISARSSFRGYDHTTARLRDVGFRCVVRDPAKK
ncbi:MAG: formylglycine-generating enzyme family protein [Leptospirillia bacterium]